MPYKNYIDHIFSDVRLSTLSLHYLDMILRFFNSVLLQSFVALKVLKYQNSFFYLHPLDLINLFFSDNHGHRSEHHGPMVAVIECPDVQLVKLGIRALDDFPCLSIPSNARDSQYQVKMFRKNWSISSMFVLKSLFILF